MENKIYKPKTCLQCPAVKIDKKDKGKIVCGCMRNLSADTRKPNEAKEMWNKCPIGWDKKENKNDERR